MPQRNLNQIAVSQAMIKAFGSHANSTDAASTMFPTREAVDNSSQDATEVNNFLTKVKNSQASRRVHRSLYTDVSMARNSELQRPDTTLKFLFRCRKNHMFYDKVESSHAQPENINTMIPVLNNENSPASPIMRRAVSKDSIHKFKEEMTTPLSQLNTTGSSGSRSKFRSLSIASGQGSEPLAQLKKSTERISNPFCFNLNQGTPLTRPGFRVREELKREMKTRKASLPPIPRRPLFARMGMTSTVPMDVFLKELKGALQGISGTYFINDGRGHLIVSNTCALNESVLVGIQDLLSLGNTCIDLKRMPLRKGQNITKTVLLATAEEILNLYITDIGEIVIQNSKYGVQTLVYKALPWLFRLNMLKRSLSIMDQSNALMLEELYSLWISCQGTESKWVMDLLLEAAFGVFCNSMRRWMTSGELVNDKWIIQERETGYVLAYKPTFTNGIELENILKIGISQPLIAGKNLDKLEDFHNSIDAHIIPKNLLTTEGRIIINRSVKEMADWIGRRVKDQLITEGKLMEYLAAARRYLLLDDAVFAMALHKCIRKISKGTILSGDEAMTAFATATRQSPSAKQFPFRVVIDSIVSSDTSPVGTDGSEFAQLLHPFLLVTGISEKIFHETQPKYETLFHFLWAIQTGLYTAEGMVDRLRQIHRPAGLRTSAKLKKLSPSGHLHRLFSTLCTRIVRLFLAIRQYSLVAISQAMKKFHGQLEESSDIDSSLEQHHILLKDLELYLFCSQEHEQISALLSTLVQKTVSLSNSMAFFENELFAQDNDRDASESLIEFVKAEQYISFSSLKTKILVADQGFSTIILQLKKHLEEMKTHLPLISIIWRESKLDFLNWDDSHGEPKLWVSCSSFQMLSIAFQ